MNIFFILLIFIIGMWYYIDIKLYILKKKLKILFRYSFIRKNVIFKKIVYVEVPSSLFLTRLNQLINQNISDSSESILLF